MCVVVLALRVLLDLCFIQMSHIKTCSRVSSDAEASQSPLGEGLWYVDASPSELHNPQVDVMFTLHLRQSAEDLFTSFIALYESKGCCMSFRLWNCPAPYGRRGHCILRILVIFVLIYSNVIYQVNLHNLTPIPLFHYRIFSRLLKLSRLKFNTKRLLF